MAFDKTQPAPNLSLRLSNPLILANWAALEAALSEEHSFPTNGMHKFVTLVDRESDPETPAAGKSVFYPKSGLPYIKNSAGTVLRVMIGEGGGETKCWFGQNVAPTGWTIDETAADCMIGVKGGSGLFNVDGGSDAGSWTPTPHMHGVTTNDHHHDSPLHTHNAGTLAGPLHYHTVDIYADSGTGSLLGPRAISYPTIFTQDGYLPWYNQGSGGVANVSGKRETTAASGTGSVTGSTASGGAGNTSSAGGETVTSAAGASPATDRPKSRIGIICSLN